VSGEAIDKNTPPYLTKRKKAILDAAYSLFVEKGYGMVSVDDIIRISGGSKTTLYKLFGSKEGVLQAVVESHAKFMLEKFKIEFGGNKSTRENLEHIGEVLVDLALSENAISQFRIAVANAGPFPEAARLWYESGPSTTLKGIADFFERENSAGRLKVDDPMEAAAFFGGMILFKENMVRLIGGAKAPKKELNAMVVRAVDLTMKAYAS